MAIRHQARWRSGMAVRRLRNLWRSETGAEIVQLALMVPIIVGIVWITANAFQLVSLRSKMRTTASQMALYISAYAVPPENPEAPVPDLCNGLREILYRSFVEAESNLGAPIVPTVSLYVINDPSKPTFEDNSTPVTCQTLADRLQLNQQFAIELNISVDWLWLKQRQGTEIPFLTQLRTLNMVERAFGVAPGEPWFLLRDAAAAAGPGGGGGCPVAVSWSWEGSFAPQRIEIYEDNDQPENLRGTIYDPATVFSWNGTMASGNSSAFVVKAISGAREDAFQTNTVGCNVPAPTPVPTP